MTSLVLQIVNQQRLRANALVIVLSILTAVAFCLSLMVGPAAIGLDYILRSLFGGESDTAALIIQEVRLPRALLGILIGATLGLSGAALQGFLRNPLAEPGIIGVSASAALGAVLTLYTGISALFVLALPLGGIVGACVGVVLVSILAGRNGGSITLILAGVAVTSFASALTALVLNLAPNPFAVSEIVFWMMGSLTDRSMTHVWLAAPFMIVGWIILLSVGRPLDALTLGEDTAHSLGFNIKRVRAQVVIGTALCVGAATSVAGAIGFVGLVVPHLLRPFVKHKPSQLLLASALGGAILVLSADILVRVVTPGVELKLGVVTALVGAPFFLMLILQASKKAL